MLSPYHCFECGHLNVPGDDPVCENCCWDQERDCFDFEDVYEFYDLDDDLFDPLGYPEYGDDDDEEMFW